MRNPRLAPLSKRLNAHQLEKRATKMIARRQVAATLHQQLGQVVNYAMQSTEPLQRGFLGRLKWLLLGR